MILSYLGLILLFFLVVLFVVYMRIRKPAVGSSEAALLAAKTSNIELLEVRLSRNEEDSRLPGFSSMAAENMFAALHGLLRDDPSKQEHISFEIVSSGNAGLRFFVAVPHTILKFVESQIYAQYPTAEIKVVEDYTRSITEEEKYEVATLRLTKPVFFPIKSFRDFEIDPIAALTSAVASVTQGEEIWIQLMVKPIPDVWQKDGFTYVKTLRDGGNPAAKNPNLVQIMLSAVGKEATTIATGTLTNAFKYPEPVDPRKAGSDKALPPRISGSQELELRAIENKLSKMGYEVSIRVLACAANQDRVESNIRSALATFRQYSTINLNTFVHEVSQGKENLLKDYKGRCFDSGSGMVLNTEELATIFHFPTGESDTPNMSWVYSRKSEPPSNLPTDDCVYIGETMYRNKRIKFGLKDDDDRLRHLYVIGKSGTGKSTLFESMITQDIVNGAGVGVLDPHGETIDRILERIPDNRLDDVIYFDPSDTERPIGLNLLEIDDPSQKNLMASGLVAAIKQHFDYSWGPRLEYLLNYAILTLLEVPGTNMLGITRLLEDKNYQSYILHSVKDPLVIKFWETEFKEMKGNQKLVTEAISPIQNKVNRFLASTTIRNVLGQRHSTLDIEDAMNSGKILLINLSKGKIGGDNANLLGALLVSRIQFYALQRANLAPEKRKPFYLYVDEFQNFATGSFEEILSESRKYKLGLYLTHQFTAQLPEALLKAVYGNVGTIMSFSLGAPDAKELANEFAPYFTADDIISLERFHVYMKLMVDGMTSHPFSARILVPWEDNFLVGATKNRERAIQLSREKYGNPREHVEAKINKWIETKFDKGMAIAQEYKNKASADTASGTSSDSEDNGNRASNSVSTAAPPAAK